MKTLIETIRKDEKALAILSIAAIEVVALLCGEDGIALSVAVGAIAGIAGYHIRGARSG